LLNFEIKFVFVVGLMSNMQMGDMSGTNSVGYAATGARGIIRTNLDNIDYATNGTIYRRPQLHNSSIYERTNSNSNTSNMMMNNNNSYLSRNTMNMNQNGGQLTMKSMNQNPLPPPPPPSMHFSSAAAMQSNDMLENYDFDEGGDDEDEDLIPNWVPIDRCLEKVITTYEYEGLREDELSFKEGMFIYVIKKNDDHWYEGIMQNEHGKIVTGLYPFNYATVVRKYTIDNPPRISEC
jgi:hypothetical protein